MFSEDLLDHSEASQHSGGLCNEIGQAVIFGWCTAL